MKEHMDKVEFLLQRYNFEQLNQQEQKLVVDVLGSAEAYQLLRMSMTQAKTSGKDLKVKPSMKASLMADFRKQHSQSQATWTGSFVGSLFQKQVPAYLLLILLLIAVVPYFVGGSTGEEKGTEIAYVEVSAPADTVYVSVPADTVFQDKIVYRKVYVTAPSAPDQQEKEGIGSFVSSDVNTSLADNEALTDLTVSID